MTSSNTNPSELNSELESFRQQWISDLRHRNDHEPEHQPHPQQPVAGPSRRQLSHVGPSSSKKAVHHNEDDEYFQARVFDEDSPPAHEAGDSGNVGEKELVSALDHYEEAMEKEAQGNMGDSLKLYRKAYRLDNRVDRTYREKHFPASKTAKPSHARQPSTTTSSTKPNTDAASPPSQPLPIGDLIASFINLTIEPAPPLIENTPPPPCPIASLPDEILLHILRDTAITDVADFARLSLVCKHFAYLVATEQRIWQRIALGPEIGFAAMHYAFETEITGTPLPPPSDTVLPSGVLLTSEDRLTARRAALTPTLSPYPSWQALLRNRPRIRFNGVYISTVNYVRTGQAAATQSTWNQPIHIVTYYRYLRFLRPGTLLSLLTTSEPADVVHHLTPANVALHRANPHAHHHLPSAVVADTLLGRWRLGSSVPVDGAVDEEEPEQDGDLFVETEGVSEKYTYRMDLSMRNAGRATRNNKLVWKGFYLYNKQTDDWGEFGLKNDKPFFFSRVKSYGTGEDY